MEKKVEAKLQHTSQIVPSDEIYKRNLIALRRRYPSIAYLINALPSHPDYELFATSSGILNFRIKPLQFQYYASENPLKDAEENLASYQFRNVRMAVFLSIGLGYDLMEYVRKHAEQQKTSVILVIEKNPYIFQMALRAVDLTAVFNNDKVHFMVGVPEAELSAVLQQFYRNPQQPFFYLKSMVPICHKPAQKLNHDYYSAAVRKIEETAVARVLDFGNSPDDSIIGIRNMFANLDEIVKSPGINLLYDKFKGKPGIVVSSGPSLNKNKHLLKGLEDKALIVCANSTFRALMKDGIKPHMIAAMERDPECSRVLAGYSKDEVEGVYLSACPVLDNLNYQVFHGPRIMVYRSIAHFDWLGIDKGTLAIQLSAGNMAFNLAAAMGCDPIIIIGQDLAFGEDDRTHTDGVDYGEHQHWYYERPRIQVPGNLGKPVWTDKTFWYSCLKAYELDVAEYRGTVINSTEGGAYIHGTLVMPFQEAINRHIGQPLGIRELIKKHLAVFSEAESRQDFSKIESKLALSLQEVAGIIGNAQESLVLWEGEKEFLTQCLGDPAKRKKHAARLKKTAQKLQQARDRCADGTETWRCLLMHIIQSWYIHFEIEAAAARGRQADEEAATAENMMRLGQWFQIVLHWSRQLETVLKETAQHMGSLPEYPGGLKQPGDTEGKL